MNKASTEMRIWNWGGQLKTVCFMDEADERPGILILCSKIRRL